MLKALSWTQAGTLLHFIFGEAPTLSLEPKADLTRSERIRLQRYTAAIAARYTAVASLNAVSHSSAADSKGSRHMAIIHG